MSALGTAATFLVGTSGWSYPHWKGLFYPSDSPSKKWFQYYRRRFMTVEINATFYRRFKDQTYHNWRGQAPEGFRYVLKAPRFITHRKYLQNAAEEIQDFSRSAQILEEKLGLILLQLHPQTPYEPERLKKALLTFGDPSRVAVEFRHERWFTEETFQMLKGVGAVFCSADSPHTELLDRVTAREAYIRLHGREHWYTYNYSPRELAEIAALARRMHGRGARRVYLFFNNDFNAYAPQNALQIKELLENPPP